jgi:hypothetical protein
VAAYLIFWEPPAPVDSVSRILDLYSFYNCKAVRIEDTILNTSSVVLSVVTGILCLATCYLAATHALLSVVICASVATGIHIHQAVVQQRSIPRGHGNVLSEAASSRRSYFDFQASCHNIFVYISLLRTI